MPIVKPFSKPNNPCFGSGPCAKIASWKPNIFEKAALGRSHRSHLGLQKIRDCLDYTREVLEIPPTHQIALISGSATGAFESLLWNLLGPKPIGVLKGDVFSQRWANDITQELKLKKINFYEQDEFKKMDFSQDIIFVWNGTASGWCAPQEPWIDRHRTGLTICDATSAAFIVPLPWDLLDATAFSWQKGLGGEAGVGVLVLGPRAIERLESYTPSWPIPYIYKLTSSPYKLNKGLFEGQTLNTLSLLLLEENLYALRWAKKMGGIQGMYRKTLFNFSKISQWVTDTSWVEFLTSTPHLRSPSSVCLRVVKKDNWEWIKAFCDLLEKEEVGFDLKNHMAAPPSLRIWSGPTVEADNLEALFPWLEWGYLTLASS